MGGYFLDFSCFLITLFKNDIILTFQAKLLKPPLEARGGGPLAVVGI